MQLGHVTGAFLDGDDVLHISHGVEELLVHAHAHAARVVVEHDRQAGGAVYGFDVHGDFLLGRQRVGRGAYQQGVGPDFLGGSGIGHRVFGADGASADDQRQTAVEHVLGLGSQVEALLGGVGVVLASGTANDHAMDLGLDQVFQDIGERGLVDAAIGRQRRDGRGVDTFEFHD
ncbi:hypothetical protein D3C73_623690 [compost metagenome]